MERVYPFLSHNLKRSHMTPILVPNEEYDRCLDSEWSNPNGVERVDSPSVEPVTVPAEPTKNKGGRPKKAAK